MPQLHRGGSWSYLYDTTYQVTRPGSWELVLMVSPQDKDDEKAGVKSVADRLGEGICPALSVFDAACILCVPSIGWILEQIVSPILLDWRHRTVPPVFDTFGPLIMIIHKTVGRKHGHLAAAIVYAGLVVDHYFKLASLAE